MLAFKNYKISNIHFPQIKMHKYQHKIYLEDVENKRIRRKHEEGECEGGKQLSLMTVLSSLFEIY